VAIPATQILALNAKLRKLRSSLCSLHSALFLHFSPMFNSCTGTCMKRHKFELFSVPVP
jgi:hypothetical protein